MGTMGQRDFFASISSPRRAAHRVPVRVSWPSGKMQMTSPAFRAWMALDRDSRGLREEMGRQLKSSRIQPSQRMATNSSATINRMGRGQMRERNSASP